MILNNQNNDDLDDVADQSNQNQNSPHQQSEPNLDQDVSNQGIVIDGGD